MKLVNVVRRILLLSSLVLLLAALGIACSTALFLHRSEPVAGKILSVNARVDDVGGGADFYPSYSFVTKDGRQMRVNSTTGSNRPGFTEGEQVRVLYDPARPEEARLDSFQQLWSVPLVVAMIGLAQALTGSGLLLVERLRARRLATA